MARFNKKVTKILKESGWYSGRRVNIDIKEKLMTKLGYILTKEMKEFLIEFYGLSLTYSNGDNLFDFITYEVDFHIEQCIKRKSLIGENVIPVGSFCNSNYMIVIADNQKMYCYDLFENVYGIGSYYDEGIEFICIHGLSPYKYLTNKLIKV